MSIANTTLAALRADVAAAIEALTLANTGHTPNSDVSFVYLGENLPETLGFRQFTIAWDLDAMAEGRWHGGASNGVSQIEWVVPMIVRVGYDGLGRHEAEESIASDKRALWAMIHDAEGGDIAGMLPGETQGISSTTTGLPGKDGPFHVDYTIDVHYMAQDT